VVDKEKKFLVVNAFADGPFGGNPAGVFPDAYGLDDATMQSFARQLNLVESVFVTPSAEADYRLRYFTPNGEVPVAGHPSLAAWIALSHQKQIDATKKTKYTQINKVGTQDIEFDLSKPEHPIVTMKQPPPRFLEGAFDSEYVASVFSIDEKYIDTQLPIHAVDCGLGHLIVPLRTLDGLMRVRRNIEPLRKLCQQAGVREAQLFCFETLNKTYNIHTRNLCPREGLEDPACGNGNGALAAYLSRYCWTERKDFTVRAEQGHIVNLPSIIYSRAIRNGKQVDVSVGGTGVVMLEGQFLV
jgi:trans-2,3-dihydro-3-hydroxyanthranilate isomerase